MSQHPAADWTRAAVHCAMAPSRWAAESWRSSFDALRWTHAAAARSGLIRRSLRESAAFENSLVVLEQAALGPLARRI